MLPLGAVAVALLLNGAQILLPAPAFVEAGRTWVPARAVLQRLGYAVRWQTPPPRLEIRLPAGTATVFPVQAAEAATGDALPTAPAARRLAGTVYLSLAALRPLGLNVAWDAATRQALLQYPLALPPPSLAAILADPPLWNGQPVTLTGEYLGWTPEGTGFATRGGAPVSSGDWVLHNEDGEIYCSPAPASAPTPPAAASLTRVSSPPPAFTPYAALGERLVVSGSVRLTRQARPYLEFTRVQRPSGTAGLTCRLVLSRQVYEPGAQVAWSLQLANPTAARVALSGVETVTVTLAGPDGTAYLTKQSFPWKTSGGPALAAGEEASCEGVWRLPAEATVGPWAVVARLGDEIGTYRRCFTVQPCGAGTLAPD